MKKLNLFIGIQIIILVGIVITLFKPLTSYQFIGRELICENGIYLEDFLESGKNGYYFDSSMIENLDTEAIIKIPTINLKSGSYKVVISCNTQSNVDTYTVKCDDNIASVVTGRINEGLKPNEPIQEFVFSSYADINGFVLEIKYGEVYYLFVDSISIYETREQGIKTLFLAIFICGILDFVYVVYKKKREVIKENMDCYIVLIGIVIVSSIPLFSYYLYEGPDLMFHLNRIEGIKDALLARHFPVRMQYSLLNEYGYPVSIYYGDLFLYVPAILRIIGFSIQTCYKIYLILVNLFTCLFTYTVAKKIFEDKYIGVCAAFNYMLVPYRLMCLYLRAAVGEVTAMCFYPLILYGVYQIYGRKKQNHGWIFLALGFVGVINCHIISTFIAGLFVAIYCIFNYKRTVEKEVFFNLIKAVMLALGLALWFVVPFMEYMQFDIRVNHLGTQGMFSSHGVYLNELLDMFPRGVGSSNKVEHERYYGIEMPYALGMGLVLVAIAFFIFLCKYCKEKDGYVKFGKTCLIYGGVATFMTTIYFPWDIMIQACGIVGRITKSIQFPWRFLSVATILLSFTVAAFLTVLKKRNNTVQYYAIMVSICFISFISANYFMNDYVENAKHRYIIGKIDLDMQDVGNGEYIFEGVSNSIFDNKDINAEEGVKIHSSERLKNIFTVNCENLTANETYLDIPVLYYKDYRAVDMTKGTDLDIEAAPDGKIRIFLPEWYQGSIHVYFDISWYWRVCEMVSMFTFISLMLFGWKNIGKDTTLNKKVSQNS